jgi:hypothetical protein
MCEPHAETQRPGIRSQRGSALLIAMLSTLLLSALGMALVMTTTTETMITSNYRDAQETMYAADAGIERALEDLLRSSDFGTVLAGTSKSGFTKAVATKETLPDGTPVNLTALTTNLQADSDAFYGATNANRPVWRVYANAPLSTLLASGTVTARDYVVVWVSDDPAETDGKPATDVNGILILHAEAFGEGGSRKAVEATIAATFATDLEDGYLGQRGMGEASPGRRNAPAGTPGQKLTEMRMNIQTGGMVTQP